MGSGIYGAGRFWGESERFLLTGYGPLTIIRDEGIENWVLDEYEDCFSVSGGLRTVIARLSFANENAGVAGADAVVAGWHSKYTAQ